MRRRDFIAALAGAACPFAARGQQREKLPTIGFLGAATPLIMGPWIAASVQRLRELGWIEGQTVAIEVRWAEGRSSRFTEIADEFVQLKVDVIVTAGAAVSAAKQATAITPIVFAVATDPVSSGFVASLSRPGGNVTGLSIQSTDLASKRLELLRELVPGLRRLAIMANVGYPAAVLEMRQVETMARALHSAVVTSEIRRVDEIEPTIGALKGHADALYVCTDPLVGSNVSRINAAAINARLPTMHTVREYVVSGGLISYGPNYPALFRRAADYVDKILRGSKPGDLPVEQPTKFDLIVNMKAAKALGLTISEAFLLRADEVIE